MSGGRGTGRINQPTIKCCFELIQAVLKIIDCIDKQFALSRASNGMKFKGLPVQQFTSEFYRFFASDIRVSKAKASANLVAKEQPTDRSYVTHHEQQRQFRKK
jgi:hypothetical protein